MSDQVVGVCDRNMDPLKKLGTPISTKRYLIN
jgi:hypothetical protein